MGRGLGPRLLVFGCLLWFPARAAELPPLPEPLSLADAIALAHPDLPAVELALAEHDARAASLAEAEALSGVRVSAIGRLGAVDPSSASRDPGNGDSSARLALSKRLYDFGYSAALEASARLAGAGSAWRALDARQESRLNIMRRFYDVILADLQFARDNEAMAGAFVDADRARDRHELKRLSDVDLLESEAAYQAALQVRTQSQSLQRAARSQLAIAMGRPTDLVADLVRPPAPASVAELPDYAKLLEEVKAGNPQLKALRAELAAARAGVEAARNGHGPVLSGEFEAAAYERKTGSTHPLGAALVLEVPLLTGGARDADLARARAELRASEARLAALEQSTGQQVLDLWLHLDSLRVTLDSLRVRGDYRELYLDRSRALYELEVRTDLGDAMTEISAVRLETARAEFDWLMGQARLQALTGRLLPKEQAK